MKKHDFGAWFLLCGLLFLFTPGVSAMAEETEPLFAFAAQAEEVRPGGSFAVTCTPARGTSARSCCLRILTRKS